MYEQKKFKKIWLCPAYRHADQTQMKDQQSPEQEEFDMHKFR